MRLPASHQILSLLSRSHTFFLVLFFQSVRRNSICSPFLTFSNSVSFFLSHSHTHFNLLYVSLWLCFKTQQALYIDIVDVLLWKNKGVFPLGRFDSGAIALLVRFIWVSMNTGVQTLVRFDWGYVYTCSSVLLGLRSHWDWHKSSCLQIRPVCFISPQNKKNYATKEKCWLYIMINSMAKNLENSSK